MQWNFVKTSYDPWGLFASDHLYTSHQASRQLGRLYKHLQNLPGWQSPLRCPEPAVLPIWGPGLPIAFLSSSLVASVSSHCCWQDFDGPNTEVGAKLKWLKTSPAAAWLRSTLTSFRNVQLMQDADAGVRAAKASGVPILGSIHHAVTGVAWASENRHRHWSKQAPCILLSH